MKALRVHINGWLASFRNPLFISGFQPTLRYRHFRPSTAYCPLRGAIG